MMRLATKGPRSLTVTSTLRPFTVLVTLTRLGSGSVLWAAVKLCMS